MSLRQAIKGLIVVVAVMFGTAASAFAHAGHAHAQMSTGSSVESTGFASAVQQAVEKISGAVAQPSSTNSNVPIGAGQSVQSAAFHSGVSVCPPGACCCQGASSCSMGGHCCSMMPDPAQWPNDLSNHMRYHLARLGWVYPDVVIGLDRPPKA